jgi:protein-S-isoprenylcysteine O-methyltransferase Ste14
MSEAMKAAPAGGGSRPAGALIIVGYAWFEERDLVRSLGGTYTACLSSVPALIPGLRSRRRRA